jgi:hypothetical protein
MVAELEVSGRVSSRKNNNKVVKTVKKIIISNNNNGNHLRFLSNSNGNGINAQETRR